MWEESLGWQNFERGDRRMKNLGQNGDRIGWPLWTKWASTYSQQVRFMPAAKAERGLSLLPALAMRWKRAAHTPFLEKLDVKACPLDANGAIKTLWSETLQTTNWTAK